MEETAVTQYVLEGTIPGLIQTLQTEFDLSRPEARFFVFYLSYRLSEEPNSFVSSAELEEWFQTNEQTYQGQILKWPLYISFDSVKKGILDRLILFVAIYLLNGEADLITLGIELLYTIATAIQRIEADDYCVFARIVELCVGNKDRIFSCSEICPPDKDGKCNYQSELCRCPHFGSEDDCCCTPTKVEVAVQHLQEQNIIKAVGKGWRLVR